MAPGVVLGAFFLKNLKNEMDENLNPFGQTGEKKKRMQYMKPFDLERRTGDFAGAVRLLVKRLSGTVWNREDGKQLIRSSGSVGANYLEANEAISKRDFIHRLRVAKKEARESAYWLGILDVGADQRIVQERARLVDEAGQLVRIFGSIIGKIGL